MAGYRAMIRQFEDWLQSEGRCPCWGIVCCDIRDHYRRVQKVGRGEWVTIIINDVAFD